MKHRLAYADSQESFDAIQTLLTDGYELDPDYESKPLRCDVFMVWPLVLYESDLERDLALAAKDKAAEKVGEFDDVEDVKSAEFIEVAELKKQGWVVQALYAKNVLMLKRKPAQPVPAGVV